MSRLLFANNCLHAAQIKSDTDANNIWSGIEISDANLQASSVAAIVMACEPALESTHTHMRTELPAVDGTSDVNCTLWRLFYLI